MAAEPPAAGTPADDEITGEGSSSNGGLERIIFFGDAVVAIAITLLVLPLVDLPSEDPTADALTLIRDHSFEFVVFLISFAVIGKLWLVHHSLFRRIANYDRQLLSAQFLWLLAIVFLPFPTELLGMSDSSRSASALYIAVLAVNAGCLAWMGAHIDAHPRLRTNPVAAPHQWPWLTPGLMLVAFALAITIAGLGPWALLVLFLEGPIRGVARRRAARAGATTR
jgi:uncharacterized membrane protein